MGDVKIGLVYSPTLLFRHLLSQFHADEIIIFVFAKERRFIRELNQFFGVKYKIYRIEDNLSIRVKRRFRACQVIVADSSKLVRLYQEHPNIKNLEHKVVVFSHGTDGIPLGTLKNATNNTYLIAASENCARSAIPLVSKRSEQAECLGKAIWLCYAGLFHIDIRASEKSDTRERLVERFGLDPIKPIVTVFIDEISDFKELHQGLSALVSNFNIIVKTMPSIAISYSFDGIRTVEEKSLNDTLRFGSDFILAGSGSGTLTTCAMLGHSVIPYYTSRTYENSGTRKLYYSGVEGLESTLLSDNYKPIQRWHGFDKVVQPVLITSPALQDCLGDTRFWEQYHAGKEWWQEKSFGRYFKYAAAAKTADLVRSILSDEEVDKACLVRHFS